MSENELAEIRFRIPKKVYDQVQKHVEIEVGDYVIATEKVNSFARTCFYLGLNLVLKGRKPLHDPAKEEGSAKLRASAESELKKNMKRRMKEQ